MSEQTLETGFDYDSATLPELIGWAADHWADVTAIVDGDYRPTYREFCAVIDQAARAFVASGIQPGDTIGVWAPNRWEWVVSALGAVRAGGVIIPVNTRFKGNEAGYVLAASSARMVVVANGFLDTDYVAALSDQELPDLAEVIDMSGSATAPTGTPAAVPATSFQEFLARGESTEHQAEVEARSAAAGPDDISAIMFTSGTTGLPKGVLVKGSAIIRAFSKSAAALGVQPGERLLLVNPYFHAFGLNCGIVKCFITGATNVPVAVFDAEEVLALIEREGIAVFPGPPALFQSLLNHPRLADFDLSSLRACMTGAATVPVELVLAMQQRLGFDTVMTAYGMTETSGLASFTRPDDPPELIASTSGRSIPGVELRVVDDDLVDVAPGTEGELLIRGYQITPGYLDDPEKTAETITPDGWLRTGDVAVMNAEGYIDITDRKKDMFIMGGFNAYPAEIERMMVEHPGIGLVAVIGVPDERMGEVGAAFVIRAPGAAETEADIIEWCREQMANYKVPRFVRFVDELPMTASGKVQKPELRAIAATLQLT